MMLEENRKRVQNLSAGGIWLFIIGRVLVAFGLGITATLYLPRVFGMPVAIPVIVAGLILLLIAARGLKGSK
jgi:uncharacterized protein (DUF983 family)